MKVRELLIHWGFEIDDKPLKDMETNIENAKAALAKTAIVVAGVSAAIGYAVKKAGDFQAWEIQFETLTGSAEKAKKFLEDLEMFGLKSSFEFPSLARASKLLIGMGIAMEDVIPNLKMLGDVAVGANMDVEQLTEAYLKIRNMSGSLEGRQARMIIGKIPQFVAALNSLYGTQAKTFEELENLKGSMPFEDITKAFQILSSEGGAFGNLMAKLDDSALGAMGDIKEWFGIIAKDVGTKLLPKVKQLADQVLAFIEANRKLIAMRIERVVQILLKYVDMTIKVLKSFAQSFGWVINLFGGFEGALKLATIAMTAFLALNLATALGSILIAVAKTTSAVVALGWAGLWANIKLALIPTLIGAAFIALGLIIEDIIAYFQGRKSITGAIVQMVQTSNSPLAKLARLFWLMIEPTIQFLEIIKNIVIWFADGGIQKAIDSICERLPWLSEAVNILASVFSAIMRPILLPFELLGKAIEFLVGTVFPKLGITFENFARTFGVILNPIAGLFNLIKSIFNLIQNLDFSKITTGIQKIAGTVLKPFEIGMNLLGIKTPKNNQAKDEVDSKTGFDFSGITKGIGSFVSSPKSSKFMSGFDNFATAGFGMPELSPSPVQAIKAPMTPMGKSIVQNVSLDNKIEVKVPPNTPPDVAGQKVKEGVSDALSRMLRTTYKLIEDRGDE